MLFKLVCNCSSSKFLKEKNNVKCVSLTKKARLVMKLDSLKEFSKNEDEQEKNRTQSKNNSLKFKNEIL